MAAILNYSKLSVVDSKLYCPPLEELKIVLKKHLEETFEVVQVDVVDCPDLTNPPFNLASQGLNGSPTIVDVGGPPYLLPLVQRDKVYSFQEIGNYCGNVKPAFIIGAGAGPWPYANTNCEMVANLKITNNEVENKTRIVKMLDKSKAKFQVEILPNNELRYALLGNFFISQGKPGKVLKIHCEKRKGEDNYVTAIRKGLNSAYPSKPVGLGGVFLLGSGKAKQHIMQDFSETPIKNEQDLNDWLFFSDMDAPLVNVGTIVSEDPGLDLRVQHFHSFNVDGKAGGHYHYDTTPETVVYTGYFNTAPLLYRIDQPEHAHTFGHD